jgi:hypothetical protein
MNWIQGKLRLGDHPGQIYYCNPVNLCATFPRQHAAARAYSKEAPS